MPDDANVEPVVSPPDRELGGFLVPDGGSENTLKHLAFFEELSSLDGESPEWRSVAAGLVVLRLVDACIEEGQHVVAPDAWGMRAVRAAVAEMEETTPARAI